MRIKLFAYFRQRLLDSNLLTAKSGVRERASQQIVSKRDNRDKYKKTTTVLIEKKITQKSSNQLIYEMILEHSFNAKMIQRVKKNREILKQKSKEILKINVRNQK